jgi:hypothetical protein
MSNVHKLKVQPVRELHIPLPSELDYARERIRAQAHKRYWLAMHALALGTVASVALLLAAVLR